MKASVLRPQSRGTEAPSAHRRSMSTASTASYDSVHPGEVSFAPSEYVPATNGPRSHHTQPLPLRQTSHDDPMAALHALSTAYGAHSSHPGLDTNQYRFNPQGSIDPQLQLDPANRFMTFDQPEMPQNGMQSRVEVQQSNFVVNSNQSDRPLQNSAPVAQNNTDGERKEKKATNTSAANEKELRELLDKNAGRTLESVARDVKSAERTAKSEKAKQLFAMRWLQEFCKSDKESVPRNRVYTHYAQRCGTDRVDTLNPASFGKLVRVIFPGIQTRRLGVRGESKYHYVNLALKEDPHATFPNRPSSAHNFSQDRDRHMSMEPEFEFNNVSKPQPDTAAFPRESVLDGTSFLSESNPLSRGLLYADPNSIDAHQSGNQPRMYQQQLKFSSSTELNLQDEPMTLPNVHMFVPAKTDVDVADALSALYRTHCTSLVDSVRFVKEKQFVRLLGSFNGTLTVPVSKLFSHPNLAPWIRACDWLMYQQIIRFVSQLALQVIPPQVFQMLANVGNTLSEHIKKNFSHYPGHVLEAKLEPATIFASLINRLLRVNETAHAAANLLIVDQNRDLMWQDWVKGVRARRLVETELPNCGYAEVHHILTSEIRQLLEPLTPNEVLEWGTEYQYSANATPIEGRSPAELTNTTAEGVLDRWTAFLKSLPTRFPHATSRTLLYCIGSVGTAAMRDITINQAQSFGGWWVTKVWVDEMVHWLAEMGGFLDSQPSLPVDSPNMSDTFENPFGVPSREERERSQSAGLGIDFQPPNSEFKSSHDGRRSKSPSTGAFNSLSKANGQQSSLRFEYLNSDGPDDSGIGMSLLEDNLGDSKFDFGPSQEMVSNDVLVS